jgi:Putative DNA-binding domain
VPLADFQAQVRGAIVDGEAAPLAALLTGSREPLKRFAIHQRHYDIHLARTLAGKFPAMEWLAGSPFMMAAAQDFIRQSPPRAPCIAEYGEGFPAFVGTRDETRNIPWLRWVGELEWRLGQAALAVEYAPLAPAALVEIAPERLADCALALQPGVRYLAAPWPVDALLELFLSDSAPASYALDAEDVFLEVRGARGAFSIVRLDAGTFAFRQALLRGNTIGEAAEQALDADATFDAGQGLVQLTAAGLATAIHDTGEETQQ